MNWVDDVFRFALTDVGIKRSHNQDAYGVAMAPNLEAWETRGHLFLVADGMGSHAVGEMASKMAVDTICHAYTKLRDMQPELALRQAIVEANQTIYEKGRQNREFKGMGTTATALVLLPDGATVGHVGDSRCYYIHGSRIEQLSFDHSLQWELARRQQINPDELTSVPSNIIIRSLGPDSAVKIDVNGPYPYQEGDRFLLCSDGLSGPVNDRELWAVASHLPGEEACQFLVDLANLRGGLDNITVLLVQIGDPSNNRKGPSLGNRSRSLKRRLMKFLRRVPPCWWALTAGLALTGIAFLLQRLRVAGVIPSALLSVLLLGVAGVLFYRRRREWEDRSKLPPPEPPPIFRPQDCSVERPLIENLARTEQTLRELAVEEHWKVDWRSLNQKRQAAEQASQADRLIDAFREYCRTISLLCAGMREHRDKHEVFLPQWQREA